MTVSNSKSCIGNRDTGKANLFCVAQGFLELQQKNPRLFLVPHIKGNPYNCQQGNAKSASAWHTKVMPH